MFPSHDRRGIDDGFMDDMLKGNSSPTELSGVWDGSSPLNELWFVVDKDDPDIWFHNMLESQTMFIKSLTVPIRYLFNHDNRSLHKIRQKVLLEQFPDAILVDDRRWHGIVNVDGKNMKIGIAGHMLNSMLAQHVWVFDMVRRMDAVELNVRMSIGGKSTPDDAMFLKVNEKFPGEPGARLTDLWHNYLEYSLAVIVYEQFCPLIGWQPKEDLIKYTNKRLLDISRKYPDFKKIESHFVR